MKYALLSILFVLNNEILSLVVLSAMTLLVFADLAKARFDK